MCEMVKKELEPLIESGVLKLPAVANEHDKAGQDPKPE